MNMRGIPDYQPRTYCRISVLIEDAPRMVRCGSDTSDEAVSADPLEEAPSVRWATWRGPSLTRLKAAVRLAYPDAKLSFGTPTFHVR